MHVYVARCRNFVININRLPSLHFYKYQKKTVVNVNTEHTMCDFSYHNPTDDGVCVYIGPGPRIVTHHVTQSFLGACSQMSSSYLTLIKQHSNHTRRQMTNHATGQRSAALSDYIPLAAAAAPAAVRGFADASK